MLRNPSIKFILGAQPHITASHMLVTRRHGVKSAREISVERAGPGTRGRCGFLDYASVRGHNGTPTSAAPSTLRDHDRGREREEAAEQAISYVSVTLNGLSHSLPSPRSPRHDRPDPPLTEGTRGVNVP